MTPLRRLNNFFREYKSAVRKESYLKINLVIAGVVVMIIAYSGIFSPDTDNYPVVCIHERITGQQCASCGLSHSFSLIVRGRVTEAYQWNLYGMQVFIFFFSQLLMRISYSVLYITKPEDRKQLIIFDIVGSAIIFLIAFFPFLRQLIISL